MKTPAEEASLKELQEAIIDSLLDLGPQLRDGIRVILTLYDKRWYPYILRVLTLALASGKSVSVLDQLRIHGVTKIALFKEYQGYCRLLDDKEHPTHALFRDLYAEFKIKLPVPKKA